jgi:7-cyano-7-deazaguanine synthase
VIAMSHRFGVPTRSRSAHDLRPERPVSAAERGAVVLFSGGQDSTTCLAWALDRWDSERVWPLSVAYGDHHEVELECARDVLAQLGLAERHRVVALDAPAPLAGTAPAPAPPSSPFVAGRNLLFFALAAGCAAQAGVDAIVTGIAAAAAGGYPDRRAEFVAAAEIALQLAVGDPRLRVYAPLIAATKAEVFALAQELGVLALVLESTHTCSRGGLTVRHEWGYGCGTCAACRERAAGWRAFTAAGG